MSLIRWEPFGELERAFDETLPVFARPKIGWDTAVDVYEQGNDVVAEMNLPGVDPEKLNVAVSDGALWVSGSREETKEEKGKEYVTKEIVRGSFSRTIRLPGPVDEAKTHAVYKDGVLMVVMPRASQNERDRKRIPIVKG